MLLQIWNYFIYAHPEATAAILALIATVYFNYRLQRKNILDSHKVTFYRNLNDEINNIQKQLLSLTNSYQQAVDSTAVTADKYLGKTLEEVIGQIDQPTLKKDLDDHYSSMKEVLDATHNTRRTILDLFVRLTESTFIPPRLRLAIEALYLDFNELTEALGQTFEMIKALDPLPKPHHDQTSSRISIEYFRITLNNIKTSNNQLKRFNSLLQDFQIMLHNDMVGKMFGKKEEESNTEIQLTRKGIVDKRLRLSKAPPSFVRLLRRPLI